MLDKERNEHRFFYYSQLNGDQIANLNLKLFKYSLKQKKIY